jgi:hypothetical protein
MHGITHLTNYCRYVDDIFLMFDSEHTNIQKILDDFKSLHPKLHFTAEAEKDHTLNYLDTSLHRGPTNITTSIYRKPTSTDTIIPFNSNHPAQHKCATIRYLYNRLNSYNLQKEDYQHELSTIHNILHNNTFPFEHSKPRTRNRQKPPTTKQNWATFTFTGKETLYITNIFKKLCTSPTFSRNFVHHQHFQETLYIANIFKKLCTSPTFSRNFVHHQHFQETLYITNIFKKLCTSPTFTRNFVYHQHFQETLYITNIFKKSDINLAF